ncbi:MAG TPA: hypothetical protein VI942_03800, partial [Thermoanaerobaculia bacterium]|nr:hypothetical protein [Thermoanaerobaculia bacterium]
MKLRTLAILALVVVALGAFIYFYERELPGSEKRRTLEKRAFGLEADEVVALELEWGGGAVRLERDPKPEKSAEPGGFAPPREWRVTAPFGARADRQLADQLAGDLAGLEIVRKLGEVPRANVGLAPARGRIVWR